MVFERETRGGVSNIPTEHSEVNHKCLKKYDHSKPSKFIQYLDANNFYGLTMSKLVNLNGCLNQKLLCLKKKIKNK